MGKEAKTNAMRMLERAKISYQVNLYECEEFIDGIDVADRLGQDYEMAFKTLVTQGKSGNYYVYVIPVHRELDMKKAAKAVGEKSVEMLPVREINQITGYIRGGCTPIGMKKPFPTVIHESAKQQAEIAISGGRHGVQIVLSPDDLATVIKADFADVIQV
ncbi:MAG: Cys-tRNA(Pro) deacylase [Lachnospiraceae bacterium]|nr:Cys-tRNA(Pro) deacylase [Lachnospiraceae bacterium]